ncbi:PREDICTED: phosphatidylinositol N-acetylglucosaminyltransferase subunit H [Phaethon lepturus]|nr:PREDICTED: phosphatidylinositol N-acetylglucosaminyltransferase subunit H [Phaethon lepturus]
MGNVGQSQWKGHSRYPGPPPCSGNAEVVDYEEYVVKKRAVLASSSVFAWLVLQNSMVLSAAIFLTLIGLITYLHFVKIDQESLLVIGSLGIQVTSSYASGKESTTFIEMGHVKDVVINEAIHMQKVIYYLCILLQDPGDPQGVSEVVPLFQSSKPRLDCLIEVYKSCQEILEQRKTAPQSSGIK